MVKVIDYTVVRGGGRKKLIKKVKAHLAAGWLLQGGVSAESANTYGCNQAMIKVEQE